MSDTAPKNQEVRSLQSYGEVTRAMLAQDSAESLRREEAELLERRDCARLEEDEIEAYRRLRTQGQSHREAIAWIDLAKPFRRCSPPPYPHIPRGNREIRRFIAQALRVWRREHRR